MWGVVARINARRTQSGMTNENRNRVQAGVPTGGQFAPERHAEAAGVTLTAASPLDALAVSAAGDLARTRYSEELGRWQRRMDKGTRGDPPWPPLPPILVETARQTENFEALPRDEQEAVLEKLEIPGAKHLLEPGQRLGNDRVQVAEDLNDPEDLGLALSAQKVIAESGIEGTITLTEAGKNPEFTIEDGPLVHKINIGARSISVSSEAAGDEWDYERHTWLDQASYISTGGSVLEPATPAFFGRIYKQQREYAVMMDVVAASSFRDSGDMFGEMNRSDRTADLTVDGTEYQLDVSGTEPALKTSRGDALHPSMVPGFLNHLATQTGHPDGDALASDLREVFRETDRRLIR